MLATGNEASTSVWQSYILGLARARSGIPAAMVSWYEQILAFAGNRGISMVGFSPRRLEDVAPRGRQRGARRQHPAMLVGDVDAPEPGTTRSRCATGGWGALQPEERPTPRDGGQGYRSVKVHFGQ